MPAADRRHADTGFGNALNVRHHSVRVLERAGADCIQLEDQVAPKRCGHFSGKEVISTEEAVSQDQGRRRRAPPTPTSSSWRAPTPRPRTASKPPSNAPMRFAEAGADILFVEAVTTADEIRALPKRLGPPQLMNMVIGGRTPIFGAEELGTLGYGIVLYANAALQGAARRHAEGARPCCKRHEAASTRIPNAGGALRRAPAPGGQARRGTRSRRSYT